MGDEGRGRRLERAFHERMLTLFERTGERSNGEYWPRYFLRGVRNHGGVEYAKRSLHRRTPQDGLARLVALGLGDESMEYVVSRERRWRPLFTADELQIADLRYRLALEIDRHGRS
jgi:hypothetical protein